MRGFRISWFLYRRKILKSHKLIIQQSKNMNDLIIYNTDDGKSHVALLVVENEAWLTQNQLAELFDTSVQNITTHIKNILQDKELDEFFSY